MRRLDDTMRAVEHLLDRCIDVDVGCPGGESLVSLLQGRHVDLLGSMTKVAEPVFSRRAYVSWTRRRLVSWGSWEMFNDHRAVNRDLETQLLLWRAPVVQYLEALAQSVRGQVEAALKEALDGEDRLWQLLVAGQGGVRSQMQRVLSESSSRTLHLIEAMRSVHPYTDPSFERVWGPFRACIATGDTLCLTEDLKERLAEQQAVLGMQEVKAKRLLEAVSQEDATVQMDAAYEQAMVEVEDMLEAWREGHLADPVLHQKIVPLQLVSGLYQQHLLQVRQY